MTDEKDNKFTDKIDDLIKEFESSEDSRQRELAKRAKRIRLTQEKFERSLSDLQQSLDYLRICIKYQVFDLEATRRENEYLRRLLEGEEDEECIG